MNTRLNHQDNLDKYPCRGKPCTDIRGRLYVRTTDKGEVWFCHDCGSRGFLPFKERTPSELSAYLHSRNNLSVIPSESSFVKAVKLPFDFTEQIPKEGLAWFYQYQIFEEDIKKHKFGYSPKYNRIILPVFNNDSLVYYQARTIDKVTKDNPKYINVRQSGAKNVFFKNFSLTKNNEVCVVEDILSAVKVGKVLNSLSLLGSYVPDSLYQELQKFAKIYLWLDRDKFKDALRYMSRIKFLTNKPVSVICEEKDPKDYSVEEIRRIIYG